MAFPKMEENVLNISALENKPKMSAAELKAIFDKAGLSIKTFINTLVDGLSASTAASNIGADVASVTTKTLQAVLNAFEAAIAERYTKMQTDTLIGEETNNLLSDFSIDLNTGVITITRKDGSKITFDTVLEKVPATFELIEEDNVCLLKITNVDGTSSQVDVTTLFNEYSFLNSDEISFEKVQNGKIQNVSASIRNNSIGLEKLKLEVVTQIENYAKSASDSASAAATSAQNAQTAANTAVEKATLATNSASAAKVSEETAVQKASEASDDAILAKSYTSGGTGTRAGEDTDNAEYYARQAQAAAGGDFLARTGDASNTTVSFTEFEEKTELKTGDTLSVLFGKIKKWFSSLKAIAFSGSYNDLDDKPSIPAEYELPIATNNILGGIKIGANLTIREDGTMDAEASSSSLIFENITVAATAWIEDTTYEEFGYKAEIPCTGVTADFFSDVTFDVTEAISGNYAPISLTGDGIVTIYAVEQPESTIIIPSIICSKGA